MYSQYSQILGIIGNFAQIYRSKKYFATTLGTTTLGSYVKSKSLVWRSILRVQLILTRHAIMTIQVVFLKSLQMNSIDMYILFLYMCIYI